MLFLDLLRYSLTHMTVTTHAAVSQLLREHLSSHIDCCYIEVKASYGGVGGGGEMLAEVFKLTKEHTGSKRK